MNDQYWRKKGYDSLSETKELLKSEPEFALLIEYMEKRDSGLRNDALATLDHFIEQIGHADINLRITLVKLIASQKLRYRHNSYMIDPEPLVKNVIAPTLDEWSLEQPHAFEPYKYKGMFYSFADESRSLVKKSYQLHPDDDTISWFVNDLMTLVENSTDYLDTQNYNGEPDKDIARCEEAREYVAHTSDAQLKMQLNDRISRNEAIIDDWLSYRASESNETFVEYCKNNGKTYQFAKVYRYK